MPSDYLKKRRQTNCGCHITHYRMCSDGSVLAFDIAIKHCCGSATIQLSSYYQCESNYSSITYMNAVDRWVPWDAYRAILPYHFHFHSVY